MIIPKISVIVVNWNGRQWLDRCLGSLMRQTYQNLEIILVDNASSDDSCGFVKDRFPDVRLVTSNTNLGFAGGNNLGVANATGEYVLLLNNDAWLDEDFVDKAHNCLRSNCWDIIGATPTAYDGDTNWEPFGSTIDLFGHPVNFPLGARAEFFLSGLCLMLPMKLYLEFGGLDSDYFMYYEDVDFFWRINLSGKRFATIPGLIVHHAGHGSSGDHIEINPKRFLWRNENCLATLLKNYSLINLLWIVPLFLAQLLCEAIIFLMLGRFDITVTYWYGLKNIFSRRKSIIEKRKLVQRNRINSDTDVMQLMYKGPGKFVHLFEWLRKGRA